MQDVEYLFSRNRNLRYLDEFFVQNQPDRSGVCRNSTPRTTSLRNSSHRPGLASRPPLNHREKRLGFSPRRSLLAALWAWRVVSGKRYFVQHRKTSSTELFKSMRLPTET